MYRRQVLGGVAAIVAAAAGLSPAQQVARSAELMEQATPESLDALNAQLPGTPYPLVALPGKGELGRVYDVPPNYETPTIRLIGSPAPYTDAAYYYVRSSEAYPALISRQALNLEIGGDRARTPRTLSFQDLQTFPQAEVGAVGQCGGFGAGLVRPLAPDTPWTKGDVSCAVWSGCSLKSVLESVGIADGAKEIVFTSASTGLSRKQPHYTHVWDPEQLLAQEPILAWQMNGGDIPLWNGAPLRVIIPGFPAPAWVKTLASIEIRGDESKTGSDPHDDSSGATNLASRLQVCSLVSTPADGTSVPVGGQLPLRGVAWDDGQGISKVETSTDDGKTWQEAVLDPQAAPFAWRVWTQTVTIDRAGPFPVMARATNAAGKEQVVTNPGDVTDGDTYSSRKLAAIFLGV